MGFCASLLAYTRMFVLCKDGLCGAGLVAEQVPVKSSCGGTPCLIVPWREEDSLCWGYIQFLGGCRHCAAMKRDEGEAARREAARQSPRRRRRRKAVESAVTIEGTLGLALRQILGLQRRSGFRKEKGRKSHVAWSPPGAIRPIGSRGVEEGDACPASRCAQPVARTAGLE